MRRGGEFATSRRGLSDQDVRFVLDRYARGVGRQNIANMARLSTEDVDRIIKADNDAREIFGRPRRKLPIRRPPPKGSHAHRRPLVQPRDAHKNPVASLITEVAERYGLTYRDMVGLNNYRAVTIIRQCAYAEVKRVHNLSLPRIGRAFGNRDHTSVLHGLRAHAARMAWVECLIAAAECEQPDLFARAA